MYVSVCAYVYVYMFLMNKNQIDVIVNNFGGHYGSRIIKTALFLL